MNESYWILSSKYKEYNKLNQDISVDNLIVGGGITGITTAYLLAKSGANVAVVDANKIGYGASGRNTGKVTSQHDNVYSKIEKKYDLKTAKSYYEANDKAVKLVEDIINENNIKCNFEKISTFIYTMKDSYIDKIKREYDICKEIGIDCEYHHSLPNIPLDIKAAMSFKNQSQFNPKQYVDQLTEIVANMGVDVYENTPMVDLERGSICKVKSRDGYIINAKNVIISSHNPWYDGLNFYFAKEKQSRSYLLGVTLKEDIPHGSYINLEDPTVTFRNYEGEGEKLLIIGGGDHKTGQGKDEGEIYGDLKDFTHRTFEVDEFKYQWSAQDVMSFDNMPYIGYINMKTDNIYVGTAYSKWGLSNGTLAAMIISDLILEKYNKYEDIFKTSRIGPYLSKDFIKENVDVATHYIQGKLELGDLDKNIEKGQGKVVNIDGNRYGVYRDYDNKLYILDITCTHLGCELNFNSAEKTWDCPCHGSRFDFKGSVLEGPALEPLKLYGQGKNDVNPKLL